MKSKKCTKCGEIKHLDYFNKNKKTKDNHSSWCKECVRKQTKKYRYDHKKPKICKLCGREFYVYTTYKYCSKKCAEIVKKIRKRGYDKKYYKNNKEYINECYKQKRKTDINFKIACYLRSRVSKAIKENWKYGHTLELLGCSVDELKKYIERLFKEGMSWDNYGTYWEIDHIRPCASFDLSKPEEQSECFHYSNLQPLTITENRSKGSKYGSCKTELI